MSIRPRQFIAYQGPLTGAFRRPLVIADYTLRRVFRSRLFTIFFIACLLPSCLFLVSIYLRYKLETVSGFVAFQSPQAFGFDVSEGWLYSGIVTPAVWVSFLLILVVGPALVAPDLKDNAMPLYLSRPLTRLQYVLGKLLVLVGLSAAVTWIPGLLLVLTNAYYAQDGWLLENLAMPLGLVATCLVWTVCLSMVALAISAWVRWRPGATLGLLGVVVIGSSVGNLMRSISGDWLGSLIILTDAIEVVGRNLCDAGASDLMPLTAAWIVLGVATACSGWALLHRIRAFEVAR